MTANTPHTADTERPAAEETSAVASETAGKETKPAEPPPAATSDTPQAAAAQAPAGRSAEARELERQLEEARTKLREAEERARENLDRWQRAQADLANYRRRAQFEREELEKFAVATLVSALLPVLDSFDRAWQTLPGNLRRLTWLSGVDMIDRQLRGTLMRLGLAEIDAEGQPFDPSLHEAIERDEHEGQPHVVTVLQAGYKLHERVLRPALVKVGARAATDSSKSEVRSPKSAEPDGGSTGEEPPPAS